MAAATTPSTPWTEAEDNRLRQLWPTSQTIEQISAAVGRTPEACKRRASKLYITGSRQRGPVRGSATPPPKADPLARNRGTAWTAEEDQRLLRLLTDGVTMAAVSKLIGRSESAIDNRARTLGLTRRTVAKDKITWTDHTPPAKRPSASDAAWSDPERQKPRYSATQLVSLWLSAMNRIRETAP